MSNFNFNITNPNSKYPFICNNLDSDPIKIRSESHFREECSKRNLVPAALKNEAHFRGTTEPLVYCKEQKKVVPKSKATNPA